MKRFAMALLGILTLSLVVGCSGDVSESDVQRWGEEGRKEGDLPVAPNTGRPQESAS